MKPRQTKAFSLLEILCVIGLIAGLSLLIITGPEIGGRAMALHSAQATVANLITAARSKAVATNRKTRLLICADPSQPERYLRYLVLQQARQSGSSPTEWNTEISLFLPAYSYVVPADLTGLVQHIEDWKRPSDDSKILVSDILSNQTLRTALTGDPMERVWIGFGFTPNFTLSALVSGPPPKGYLILAPGHPRPAGSYASGEPPVELHDARRVCGILLSAYGVPALLADGEAF